MTHGSALVPSRRGSRRVGVGVGVSARRSRSAVGAAVSVGVGVGRRARAVTVNANSPEMGCPSLETTFHSTVTTPDASPSSGCVSTLSCAAGAPRRASCPRHPSPALRRRPRVGDLAAEGERELAGERVERGVRGGVAPRSAHRGRCARGDERGHDGDECEQHVRDEAVVRHAGWERLVNSV